MAEESKHAGRPTDYTLEFLARAGEYIDSCEDTPYQLTKSDSANGSTYENKIRVKLPSIEGLAFRLGIATSTVYEWCKVHPEFSEVIDRLRQKQCNKLLENGLSGDYNPTIAKVLLTKHGYRDAQDSDITSGGKELPTPIYGGKSAI